MGRMKSKFETKIIKFANNYITLFETMHRDGKNRFNSDPIGFLSFWKPKTAYSRIRKSPIRYDGKRPGKSWK